jgi:hypothetical protein
MQASFQVFNITFIPSDGAFQHNNAVAWDTGDREIMSKAILHIWISPHQVQIVNLNMKMQFALSKVYIFISYEKTHIHFQRLKVKRMACIISVEGV